MLYNLRYIGDPVLRQQSNAVKTVDDKVFKLINQMFTIMYQYQGIGLAAPQIGIQKKIFVCNVGEDIAIVNPKIEEYTGDWIDSREGCLSIPGQQFTVQRNSSLVISGLNHLGDEVKIEVDGLHAIVFQHELAHLSGVLISD